MNRLRIVHRAMHSSFLLLCLGLNIFFSTASVQAAGAFGGQDLYHVPMSWCAVQGSPAQANPNIAGDTNTDAVLWRRHERPTDNIYIPQAGISLRSAINNAWASLNFPIIADPDLANGQVGDMNGWNVNVDGAEFNALINACDQAYANIGRAGIGITAVNANLFHDNANPANDGNNQFTYVGVIGWGGCNELPAGTCVAPYDGRIVVIDNNYLFPTVPDRTFPPSPADPGGNLQFVTTDPLDQLTGHEVGHALSLNHRNNTFALMNPGQADNNNDGMTDNINLNAAEITALRANVLNVPGLEIDPPGQFLPGNFLTMRLVDENPDHGLDAFLDLASTKAVLDQVANRVHIGMQLMGLLPEIILDSPTYAFLVDTDNNPQTGCKMDLLEQLGINSEFQGADLVATANLLGGPRLLQEITGEVLVCSADGTPVQVSDELFDLQIHTLRMHPHFAEVNDQRPLPDDFVAEVFHTINFVIDNTPAVPPIIEPVHAGVPFRVQTLVIAGGLVRDRLDDQDTGGIFILEPPSFPHCFPQGQGKPGGTVPVKFDGLLPNKEIHALLGPDLVLNNVVTDANGEGEIQLPIPVGTRLGNHLVTIGHDGLALTADCTVNVIKCDSDSDGDIDKIDLSLISKARGQAALPGDQRDANGDGRIDPVDVKICIPLCTRANCATQ